MVPEPAQFPDDLLPIEIDPAGLLQLIQSERPLELVDCREPVEFEICRIGNARLLPTTRIREWLPGFSCPPDVPLVVYCHHGIRSFHVAAALRQSGIRQAQSLSGGIDGWSQEIDPGIPRY